VNPEASVAGGLTVWDRIPGLYGAAGKPAAFILCWTVHRGKKRHDGMQDKAVMEALFNGFIRLE